MHYPLIIQDSTGKNVKPQCKGKIRRANFWGSFVNIAYDLNVRAG